MKATEYLVTVKQGETVLKQSKLSEQEAFRVLRGVIVAGYADTSSAEIALMTVTAKLKDGKAQAIEFMGNCIIFQMA